MTWEPTSDLGLEVVIMATKPKALPPEATGAFDTKGAFVPSTARGIRGMHIAAVLIAIYAVVRLPEIFSWTLLITTVVFIVGPILGVTTTFHRGETHGAFKWASTRLGRAARFVGLLWGHLAFQKDLILWALWHRIHHTFVDKLGDPHTPMRYTKWSERKQEFVPSFEGVKWSHYKSFYYEFIAPPRNDHYAALEIEEANAYCLEHGIELGSVEHWEERLRLRRHYWVSDLENDPMLKGFQRAFKYIVITRFAIPAVIMGIHGYLTNGWTGSLIGTIDGALIPGVLGVVIVWNVTWCTNSVAHLWGDFLKNPRFKKVTGFSRNIWAFFLGMLGENFHNRHHAVPSSAAHGWKKGEIDITKYVIGLMEKFRLVVDVNWAHKKRAEILAEEARLEAIDREKAAAAKAYLASKEKSSA